MWNRLAVATLLVGGLSSSAEAAPILGFSPVAESTHFVFYSRGQAKADPEKSEKELARIEGLLGQTVSTRVGFYEYENASEVAAVTGTYAGGMTYADRGEIHSTDACRDHEIVHLVAAALGTPGAFFQEGLAVALGDRGRWQGHSVDSTAKAWSRVAKLTALIARFDPSEPGAGYAVAGSFVGWLVKSKGADRVAEFFRECSGHNTSDAFAKTFGLSLDEAGALWSRSL